MTTSRIYPDRPFLAASFAVFREERVLLGSRAMPPNDTLYSIPGGVVETGETLEEAALRELFEETGVRARSLGFTGWSQFIERDDAGKVRRHFVVASFAGLWISGEGEASDELPTLCWTDLEQARDMRLTQGLLPILHKGLELVGAHK